MNCRTPYTLTLLGLAGMAVVGLYRGDPMVMTFVVLVTVLAVTALAWEAHER